MRRRIAGRAITPTTQYSSGHWAINGTTPQLIESDSGFPLSAPNLSYVRYVYPAISCHWRQLNYQVGRNISDRTCGRRQGVIMNWESRNTSKFVSIIGSSQNSQESDTHLAVKAGALNFYPEAST
jgi:hypothetical protein